MSIDYQERRIVRRFAIDTDSMLCLCGPIETASSLQTRMLDDKAYAEAGELKVVANLLREIDSQKGAESEYRHSELRYEVKVAVPRDAQLRQYLSFKNYEKTTQLEVAVEDLWNGGSLQEMAAEIELCFFLNDNAYSEFMLSKMEDVGALALSSVKNGSKTRAPFLTNYGFASLGRRCALKAFLQNLIAWMWVFNAEVGLGYQEILGEVDSGNTKEMMRSMFISETHGHMIWDGSEGSNVKAGRVLCQMTLILEDSSEIEVGRAPMCWLAVRGEVFLSVTSK